ncbi:MAG: SprT-like domain-containing protein [Chitinophagaceae bacterium]|nr:SprT-like domain-containing protein [Chitinophagaceae bacterium]
MALKRQEMNALKNFIPEGSYDTLVEFIYRYKIFLKITKSRKTLLGSYKPAYNGHPHTITVNGNLNKYHFLITLIHEMAHLITYEKHNRKVAPHGKEWKQYFAELLTDFIDKELFPEDIVQALTQSINKLTATTCTDHHLFKVLLKYDFNNPKILISTLDINQHFSLDNGDTYKILEKKRTRYVCVNISSNKKFLFPGVFEVYKE